ncbi:hypothetical protein [Niabella hibiscisoli]|uniref:hypothetical protein n=1 Tax=Niabella hibiscisoli TaxID=1825928 RepID=UPI001F10D7B7|nr:hypothetical protein [Niabella hibiscisoli]MCH5716903.1 hypothetical protein [Niabella hibiscisoli]
MKKHFHFHLIRIEATYKGNPLKASPIGILQEFFNYATAAEHAKAFDEFCLAALSNQYSWRRGSPGNALFYSEQLELLIEAAYLLHQQPELKGRRFKMLRDTLQSFFNYASLANWKNGIMLLPTLRFLIVPWPMSYLLQSYTSISLI